MKKIGVLLAYLLCLISVFAQQSIEQLESLAKKNDVSAMMELANQYETNGNMDLAIKWYKKAAKKNNIDAMMQIGFIYKNNQDRINAYKWFEKAAKQGSSEAKYQLGLVSPEQKQFSLISEAAQEGVADAQYDMGVFYNMGYNVKGDKKKATEWFLKAAKNGHQKAFNIFLSQGTGEQKLELLKELTNKGNGILVYDLILNCNKTWVNLDPYVDWVYEESKSGNPKGIEIVKNFCLPEQKNRLFEYLANEGDEDAIYQLGKYYFENRQPKESAEWLKKLSNSDNADALLKLGLLSIDGYGLEKNMESAYNYINKSANLNNVEAIFIKAKMLENGSGTPINILEAKKWYKKAADMGNQDALAQYNRIDKGITEQIFGAPQYKFLRKIQNGKVGVWNDEEKEYIVPLGIYSYIEDKVLATDYGKTTSLVVVADSLGNVGAINFNGEIMIPLKYKSINPGEGTGFGLAYDSNGKIDVYNDKGMLLTSNNEYSKFGKVLNNHLIVYKDNKIGAIDINDGKITIPLGKYSGIGKIVNNSRNANVYISIFNNKKIGAINAKTMKEVVAPIYDKFLGIDATNGIMLFENNANSTNETFFIISPEGKVLASKSFPKGYGTFSRGLEFANWCKQYDLYVGSLINY